MKGIERLTLIADTYRTLMQLDVSTELLQHYKDVMRMHSVTVKIVTKGFEVTHICAGVPGMEVQVPVKEKTNKPKTITISEATNKYEELVNGGTLSLGDLREMATAFLRDGQRSTTIERRDLMYNRHYDCKKLVDYCLTSKRESAGLSDIERR